MVACAVKERALVDGERSIADVAVHGAMRTHLNLNGPKVTFHMTGNDDPRCGHVSQDKTALTDSELRRIAVPLYVAFGNNCTGRRDGSHDRQIRR